MAPDKILLVANTDWYLYNFRLNLAHFLRENGYEVVLVSPPGDFSAELRKQDFRYLEWRVGRRTVSPLLELRALGEIFRIYREEKPLLVHHFTVKPVLYGSLAASLLGVRLTVNSVTGLGYTFLKKGIIGALLRSIVIPFYRMVLSRPGRWTIFENNNDQETFLRLGLVGLENSSIIDGVGVDTSRFSPAPEPDGGRPLIVFPARMLLDKGLGTLIEAARILRERLPVRIALVGAPDPGNPATVDDALLQVWAAEGLVEWWGFQHDMRTVYQSCNIVTLPSFGEGLPTVLIEAAACGRPIVTTDVPGCREVVTHGVNGLLVPPNDPAALANALETLINNPVLRAEMGAAGRQIALERFAEQKIINQTYAIYQRLIRSLLGAPREILLP